MTAVLFSASVYSLRCGVALDCIHSTAHAQLSIRMCSEYYGDPLYADCPVIYVGWQNADDYCWTTYRFQRLPDYRTANFGFRCASSGPSPALCGREALLHR